VSCEVWGPGHKQRLDRHGFRLISMYVGKAWTAASKTPLQSTARTTQKTKRNHEQWALGLIDHWAQQQAPARPSSRPPVLSSVSWLLTSSAGSKIMILDYDSMRQMKVKHGRRCRVRTDGANERGDASVMMMMRFNNQK
jgi:hypothetical protein